MNLSTYSGTLCFIFLIIIAFGRCAPKEEKVDVCSGFSGGQSPLFAGSDTTQSSIRTEPWWDMEYLSAPEGRIFHSAVWSGEQLLVWGGIIGGLSPGYSSSGGGYNPTMNQWITISTNNQPSERFGHCAVWTGSRMFIWGGENAGGLRSDGYLYDPGTNSWSVVSSTDAPSARLWHNCTLYSEKIYLWGGVSGDDSDILGSGAIYDPSNDSWKSMSATGSLPYAESMFGTSFVAGSQILYYSAVNTQISAYDPSNDIWQSLSDTGIPESRYGFAYNFHSNNNLFYVWGGGKAGGGENLQDLHQYDVSNDTWTILSITNAPGARIGASMNLLDDQLYVWGGWAASGDSTLKDGGIYSIDADTWGTLNTGASPTARILHSHTSTDTGFIIWGGTGYLPERSSGDQVIAYLRNGAKQAIAEAENQVEQTTAAGDEALDQLKAKVGAINLTGCKLFLNDDTLFEFLFSLAVGGAGGVYEPIEATSTDINASLPSGETSSSAAITAFTEEAAPAAAAAPESKERNCWNPYP
ncbi:MAG: Kelch repeat-containing protein [Oligoflexales bacterium]